MVLGIPCQAFRLSPTGLSPSLDRLSRTIQLDFQLLCMVPQPRSHRNANGLGFFPFARRYSENRFCFLFLQVLRCFSSLRSLTLTSVTVFYCRVPPFGYRRISAYLQLPVAFRSSSRPSSAPSAKAFTLCSYFLNFATIYSLFKDLS